jgi:hypothetical protein
LQQNPASHFLSFNSRNTHPFALLPPFSLTLRWYYVLIMARFWIVSGLPTIHSSLVLRMTILAAQMK